MLFNNVSCGLKKPFASLRNSTTEHIGSNIHHVGIIDDGVIDEDGNFRDLKDIKIRGGAGTRKSKGKKTKTAKNKTKTKAGKKGKSETSNVTNIRDKKVKKKDNDPYHKKGLPG